MKLLSINTDDLITSKDLGRRRAPKSFQERLRTSIDEIGLVEPLKVAKTPAGNYLVIDGTMRLRAIQELRRSDQIKFETVPAYVYEYEARYELRYQSDIYQDLLPSQLATLVEHLHENDNVLKQDIARYIGVSPATLRNYTGLWRLMKRGGVFSRIVDLMDVGVLPASNPYAWLRLTEEGLLSVLTNYFSAGSDVDDWIDETITRARNGVAQKCSLKFVESATSNLPDKFYREGADVRAQKRDLGLRKANGSSPEAPRKRVRDRLNRIASNAEDPVLSTAAIALNEHLG